MRPRPTGSSPGTGASSCSAALDDSHARPTRPWATRGESRQLDVTCPRRAPRRPAPRGQHRLGRAPTHRSCQQPNWELHVVVYPGERTMRSVLVARHRTGEPLCGRSLSGTTLAPAYGNSPATTWGHVPAADGPGQRFSRCPTGRLTMANIRSGESGAGCMIFLRAPAKATFKRCPQSRAARDRPPSPQDPNRTAPFGFR